MNRKQLLILIVLGVAFGGLGLFLSNRNSASWKASEQTLGKKLLGDFPINDVAQIEIKTGEADLNLVKQDEWQVKERFNYPANFTQIGDSIRKAAELKEVQTVKVGSSQLGRLELLQPSGKSTNSGTLVEFRDKGGKVIKSLLLGRKHMRQSASPSPMGGEGGWPDGRYVMVADKGPSQNVSVVSDPLTSLEPKPDQWLNKDFVKVEKLRSVAVTTPSPTNSWKIYRETEGGELKLADKRAGEEFDASKAYAVGSALSAPSFNDVLSPQVKPADTGMDSPIIARLETFDNFVYTVKIGRKTNDDNYCIHVGVTADLAAERTPGKDEKPADKAKLDKEFKDKTDKLKDKLKKEQAFEKWTYLVSKWTIDPLLKERKDFFSEKKPEAKKENSPTIAAPPKPGIKGAEPE
ncbi:MAG: DUF4340 domain-containing protein [Limisphaerales bacterium]